MSTIAIVLNSAWQGYNFRRNLARALIDNGYKVIFVAPEDKEYSCMLRQEFEFDCVNFKPDKINPIDDLKACFSLYRLFKKNKINIVLNFTIKPNIYSAIVARIMGIYSINNITGLGTLFIKTSQITIVAKLLYKIALACSTHIFFQNREDRNLFIRKNLVSFDKVSILPGSGVDTKEFLPSETENSDIFRFVLVARMIQDKGIYEYIDAAKILTKKYAERVEFNLLGELGAMNRTAIPEKTILELHNNGVLNYLGKTDNVQKQLVKFDCVVLPSYREGCPRSLMEASSMAIPVIATNVVGCNQVVDDGVTGFLCKVKDSSDLALKMESMLNTPRNDRKKMGTLGRKKMMEEFDESIIINRYLSAIKLLL